MLPLNFHSCSFACMFLCQHLSPIQSIVDELQSQFRAYEQSQEQVEHILQHWDREHGLLLVPLPSDASPAMSEMSATEKQVNFSFLYCTLYYTLGFAVKQLICDIWLRKLWPICGFCHSKLGRSWTQMYPVYMWQCLPVADSVHVVHLKWGTKTCWFAYCKMWLNAVGDSGICTKCFVNFKL